MGEHDGKQLTPREMIRAHLYPACAVIVTGAFLWMALPLAETFRSINTCVRVASAGNKKVFQGSGPLSFTHEDEKRLGYSAEEISVAKAIDSCL
jgi:hypothetical protein